MHNRCAHVILLLVIACGLFSGGYSATSANSESATAATGQTLFGPYWTTKEHFETSLLISNPLLDSYTVEVLVLDKDGDPISQFPVLLGPIESVTVSLNREVGFRGEGQLRITYPESVGVLPAQILLGHGSDANALWRSC